MPVFLTDHTKFQGSTNEKRGFSSVSYSVCPVKVHSLSSSPKRAIYLVLMAYL